MAYIAQHKNQWNLSGEISVDTAHAVLKESLAFEMEEFLAIDFAGVTNLDTAALSLMLAWMRRAKAEFCKITFNNLPHNLRSLATLYGVDTFIAA